MAITAILPFVCAMTKASGAQQIKATGLTVTVSVYKVALSGGAVTRLVNAAAATELTATGTTGLYFYNYSASDLDFQTYFYVASFTTTDTTVQQVDIASAWFDFPASIVKDAAGHADPRAYAAGQTITQFVVGTGSTVSSIVTSSLDPVASVTDQFKGLVLAFDKATTTAALRGQKTDITGSSSGGVLTCTQLTTAPVSSDFGTIE